MDTYLYKLERRNFAVVKSAKNIREKGFKLIVQNGKVRMDNDELFRYISEIENDIEYLGALNII